MQSFVPGKATPCFLYYHYRSYSTNPTNRYKHSTYPDAGLNYDGYVGPAYILFRLPSLLRVACCFCPDHLRSLLEPPEWISRRCLV